MTPLSSSAPKQKGLIVVFVIILVALALGVWWWSTQNPALAPTGGGLNPSVNVPVAPTDEAALLEQSAANVDLGDLSGELNAIDESLKGL